MPLQYQICSVRSSVQAFINPMCLDVYHVRIVYILANLKNTAILPAGFRPHKDADFPAYHVAALDHEGAANKSTLSKLQYISIHGVRKAKVTIFMNTRGLLLTERLITGLITFS
jgi:hypothetical protein